MEQERFDALTRAVAQGTNRRGLLTALSGVLVGAGFLAAPEDTTAKGKGKGNRRKKHRAPEQNAAHPGTDVQSCAKRCRKKSSKQARRKCRKRCQTPPECTTGQDCPAGELCESGVCIPIPDQCGNDADCDACERCQSGVCVAQCEPDQVCRNGQCESIQCTTDRDCGDCSRCVEGRCRWQCTVTEVCLSGAGGRCCQPKRCPAGLDCGTFEDGCGGTVRCGPDACTQPSNPCQQTTCQFNACTTGPGHDGASCDDGDVCTTGSTCSSGTCGGGTTICTDPPICRTAVGATCTSGTCTYPLAAAGSACPCGACDGAGTCTGCQNGGTCNAEGCQCPNTCPINTVRQADCSCQCPTPENGYVLINDACFRQYRGGFAQCNAECPCFCTSSAICFSTDRGNCDAGEPCPTGTGCLGGECVEPCAA